MVGLLLAALAAHGACTVGTEQVPPLCASRLPAIRTLVVSRVGHRAYAEDGDRISCGSFRPSAAQVRRFLMTAKRVDPVAADATLDRSPCQASGTITFTDGSRGRWTIEQLRVGTLIRGRSRLLLFCADCRTLPFRW